MVGHLEFIRTLEIKTKSGAVESVSAASGLVLLGHHLFVVADDRNDLAIFDLHDPGPGVSHPIFDHTLPADSKERKKVKPDFESLVFLPPELWAPEGALLAWPSGSKPQRRRAALIPMKNGWPQAALSIDTTAVLKAFEPLVPELNIEGLALLPSNRLRVFQRGNGARGLNAHWDIDLLPLLQAVKESTPLPSPTIDNFTSLDLGSAGSVAYSLTDAHRLDEEHVLVLCAAEETQNTYEDGAVVGARLGMIKEGHGYRSLMDLEPTIKFEGLASRSIGQAVELWLVTDADEPSLPAQLFRIEIQTASL